MKYTSDYLDKVRQLHSLIDNAESILIGAGAGLSASAGLTYSGERFDKHFSDFIAKYHFKDMYSAGFYPYGSLEEYWAYWSRHIYYNRYEQPDDLLYSGLLSLVHSKDYFVLTTNVDHCFQLSGFDKKRLFYTQGDYGLWQCSVPCHQKTYDNEEVVLEMIHRQSDMLIPSDLIPLCPACGKPMTMNLRADATFVQDEGWHKACDRYSDFVRRHAESNILYLELGVGGNTPGIIKYPFWQMTDLNPNSHYACINFGEAGCPKNIKSRSISIDADIADVINDLAKSI